MPFSVKGPLWLLSGDIDEEFGASLLEQFYQTHPNQPTLFLINSLGGDAVLALSLVHELRSLKRLETRAIGNCGSSAVVLLQAGRERTANPYAEFFTHNPYAEKVKLAAHEAKNFAGGLIRNTKDWQTLLSKRTHRPAKFWADFLSRDHYFGADEALRLGLIDRIE